MVRPYTKKGIMTNASCAKDFEAFILSLFAPGTEVFIGGVSRVVSLSGKPLARRGGECKTDVFVGFCDDSPPLKISVKSFGSEFIENKMKLARANQIFGNGWGEKFQDTLNELVRIANDNLSPINQNSLTLGYRADLMTAKTRRLSAEIEISTESTLEAYAGRLLPDSKRHAFVNGRQILNSGVAEQILIRSAQELTSAQDVIDSLMPLVDYANTSSLYLCCSAVNYRTGGKFERSRPLLLTYEYDLDEHGNVTSVLTSSNPLERTSTDAALRLPIELKEQFRV